MRALAYFLCFALSVVIIVSASLIVRASLMDEYSTPHLIEHYLQAHNVSLNNLLQRPPTPPVEASTMADVLESEASFRQDLPQCAVAVNLATKFPSGYQENFSPQRSCLNILQDAFALTAAHF